MGRTKIKKTDQKADNEKELAAAKKVEAIQMEAAGDQAADIVAEVKPKQPKMRSAAYKDLRSQVDRTINYGPAEAVSFVKRLSRKNHPTITADINYKETKFRGEMSFPHSTGKTTTVEIASDKTIEKIEAGNIDFDVLIADASMMPKLARHAKVLGPRGLMPNPKNGTVTKDPEKKKKELEGGKIVVQTEKKSPIIHVQIGKATQKEGELLENLQALVKLLDPNQIKKLTLSSTMGPGIKVDVASMIVAA